MSLLKTFWTRSWKTLLKSKKTECQRNEKELGTQLFKENGIMISLSLQAFKSIFVFFNSRMWGRPETWGSSEHCSQVRAIPSQQCPHLGRRRYLSRPRKKVVQLLVGRHKKCNGPGLHNESGQLQEEDWRGQDQEHGKGTQHLEGNKRVPSVWFLLERRPLANLGIKTTMIILGLLSLKVIFLVCKDL